MTIEEVIIVLKMIIEKMVVDEITAVIEMTRLSDTR